MTSSPGFGIAMIGDRINPGFKSTKALLDNEDMAGVQALAVSRSRPAPAHLDVTIGPRGSTDFDYLAKVVRAIQEAVPVALCFDSPSAQVQEVCFKAYDRARGGPALVNSITEQRWDIMDLYKTYGPFKVIVMASERMEDGIAKQNKTAEEIASTAKRAALRLQSDYGMALDDIYIDISVSAVVADTNGLHTRDAGSRAHAAQRSAAQGPAHHGRPHQYRPAIAAQGGRRLRSEALARMRLPDLGGAARLRHRSCARRGATIIRCRTTITCSPPTRIFSSRPAATRCARCASSIGREAQEPRHRMAHNFWGEKGARHAPYRNLGVNS